MNKSLTFGLYHQLRKLMEEEGAVDCLTAGLDCERFQWTLEFSKRTDAVKAIVEAHTIGMERQPDLNGSWHGTLDGVRALRVHVEMKVPAAFKMRLPPHNVADLIHTSQSCWLCGFELAVVAAIIVNPQSLYN